MSHERALVVVNLLRVGLLHSWLNQFRLLIAEARLYHDFCSFNHRRICILIVERVVKVRIRSFFCCFYWWPLSIVSCRLSFVRVIDTYVRDIDRSELRLLVGDCCECSHRGSCESLHRHSSFLLVGWWRILSRCSAVTLTFLHDYAKR